VPWKEVDVKDQRREFVLAHLRGDASTSALCEAFGISRKTGYKWIARFMEGGLPGLADLSRVPQRLAHAYDEAVVEAIVSLRKKHPTWGPRKLLAYLSKHHPDVAWPVHSTVSNLLHRRGLVEGRKPRRRTPRSTQPLASATEPNVVWCTDFKGKFRVNREYCNPLTISDAHSRFLLAVDVVDAERFEPTKVVFERVFGEYGLPLRMRSDNGSPFASRALGGLSRLSVWWVKLGILPERIVPGHPEQNGRHERMHRTLKAETASPPQDSHAAQQVAFDRFRFEYNEVRPHEALGQVTPSSCYVRSPRSLSSAPSDPDYPDEFDVRRLNDKGELAIRNWKVTLGRVLAREAVGLEPTDDGRWQLWFGPVYLGQLHDLGRRQLRLVRNLPMDGQKCE
jgi:putative transposase